MSAQPQSQATEHPAFEFIRCHTVASLNLDISEYHHRGTGARHFHFASDDDNNAFLVAFLTVPSDSSGVAHILEHTSLCGSERFPVRDPFFMMIRRSLNTFMNAFTSSDWTAYPFASKNRKDFYNLLDVYLDAVFFPRLELLDFSQEGHRVEFEKPDDPTSPLQFKGVVFNEMKGAMSAPTSQLWQEMQSELFPTVTYHHNSGGDPARIPDLSYEQLKAFHARHYHPSNAVFMTWGNLPVEQHQAVFEQRALRRFERLEMDLRVPDERRYPQPRSVDASYALDGEDDLSGKTHVVLGWLLGHNSDPQAVLTAHLLSGVLLDNGSCPLLHALETTDLGSSPSPLCGLDDSTHEMVFLCGIEGSDSDKATDLEALVIEVLREVAGHGIPKQQLESILHQLELRQREISGGQLPYGLNVMVNALAPTLHGGDPVAMLDIDPLLAQLRENIQDPEFIKRLVREQLLDNPHRVRLVMSPDAQLNARRLEAEKERLAAIKAGMDEPQKAAVVELAQRLEQRQNAEDDPGVLPKVGIADIPAQLHIASGESLQAADMPTEWYSQGTNGMVYQEVLLDLPTLDADQRQLLPLLSDCIGDVGVADADYMTTQARMAALTGGVGARFSVRSGVDELDAGRGLFIVSGRALARNHRHLAELLRDTLLASRFDELPRIRELIAQDRASSEASVTGHGHVLAMNAASAGFSRSSRLSHELNGLLGLRRLKKLDDGLNDDGAMQQLAARLEQLAGLLSAGPRQLLLVGEQQRRDDIVAAVDAVWNGSPMASASGSFAPDPGTGRVMEAWAANSQVRFCAKAYPTVAAGHADAPALNVLGGFLRNGFLHRAIREQGGAYGGGASWDSDSGGFRFYSYRDPRLSGTLDDFDASLRWLATTDHQPRALEEAILGVISSIDKPGSPASEAIGAFHAQLHGRTPEQRRDFRARVLAVTLDDLKRVGETWLDPEQASVAVVADAETLGREADGLGLRVEEL